MRFPRPGLLLALACIGLPARAADDPFESWIEALFRPVRAEQMTLAPDGRRLAYTEQRGRDLAIVVMDLERPAAKTTMIVDGNRGVSFSREREHARLRFLRWATPTRLVYAPQPEVIRFSAPGIASVTTATATREEGSATPGSVTGFAENSVRAFAGGTKIIATINAVDADGKNPRTLVDSEDFQALSETAAFTEDAAAAAPRVMSRSLNILGFLAGDRDHLLLEAEGGTGVPNGSYKVNVHTGAAVQLSEDALPANYAYDWHGRPQMRSVLLNRTRERRHELQSSGPWGRWRPLEERTYGPVAASFRTTAENYYGARAYPVGFGYDPNLLFYASNLDGDRFVLRALDVSGREPAPLVVEHPLHDVAGLDAESTRQAMVWDEYRQLLAGVRVNLGRPLTAWYDPELAAAQRALDGKFPHRAVEILEWNSDRTRFLLRVTGPADRGRIYVFQQPENLLLEIGRRAPWLDATTLHDTRLVSFDTAAGVRLSGFLTRPRQPRLNPPPLLVAFAEGLPGNPHPEFDPEAQVLAGMGFMVLRLNHRGIRGHGARFRDAALAGIDRVPVEDALAAIEWVAREFPIDRRRVATYGRGFGGYLAVRALQLHPEAFRCAVAIEAPLDPAITLRPDTNFDTDGPTALSFDDRALRVFLARAVTPLEKLSVLAQPEAVTKPVFLLHMHNSTSTVEAAHLALRSRLQRQGVAVELVEAGKDFTLGLPKARAVVYRRLEEFFNLNLYDFRVQIGPVRERKE